MLLKINVQQSNQNRIYLFKFEVALKEAVLKVLLKFCTIKKSFESLSWRLLLSANVEKISHTFKFNCCVNQTSAKWESSLSIFLSYDCALHVTFALLYLINFVI